MVPQHADQGENIMDNKISVAEERRHMAFAMATGPDDDNRIANAKKIEAYFKGEDGSDDTP